MEYKVYQVRLTAVEVDTVNTKGHNSVARHRRNLDLTCAYDKTEDEKKAMVTEAWYEGDYDPVGKVYARDLNEVFELGNPVNLLKTDSRNLGGENYRRRAGFDFSTNTHPGTDSIVFGGLTYV